MYIYNSLLRMADPVISQNIDLFSWDTLCINGSDGTDVSFGFAV
jgi:hypothetical protein